MEARFIISNLSQDNLPEIFNALFICEGHICEVFCDGREELKYDPEDKAFLVRWPSIKVFLYGDGAEPFKDLSRFEDKCDFLTLGIVNLDECVEADVEYITNHKEDKTSRWIKEIFTQMRYEGGEPFIIQEGERSVCKVQVEGINELSTAVQRGAVKETYAVLNDLGIVERFEFKTDTYSQLIPVTGSFGELMASSIIYKDNDNKIPAKFKGFKKNWKVE